MHCFAKLEEIRLQTLCLFRHIIQRRFFPSNYQLFFHNEIEDMAPHWNYTKFKGKRILDLGADCGTTPSYFLHKGAISIIAVEGDPTYFKQLQSTFQNSPKVSCKQVWIDSVDKMESLITEGIDIAKVDIECSEILLLGTSTITKIPIWLIEAHTTDINDKLTKHFQTHGFEAYHITKHMLKMVKQKCVK